MPKRQQVSKARSAAKRLAKSPLSRRIIWRRISELHPFPNNPRKHPKAQIKSLQRNIEKHGWTTAIATDENGVVLYGHGRLEAAIQLGLEEVPTVTLRGLSEADKLAVVISDNKIAQGAVWDIELLKPSFQFLLAEKHEMGLTGFSTGAIDILLEPSSTAAPPADVVPSILEGTPVSRSGDLWLLGGHRLLCGNSLLAESYETVMAGEKAQIVICDGPYNVKVQGHIRSSTSRRYREFAMASGEMTEEEFQQFNATFIQHCIAYSIAGSIHYLFTDWRHLPELLGAARPQYSEWKNVLVWKKTNAGLGAFYRSAYELIGVFKAGRAPHINNFGMGDTGRYRTNLIEYPGATAFGSNRDDTFDPHPTVKPTALISDLLRDCSHHNGIVLDAFGGSGTTLLSAERTKRRARLIEIDPLYVDLTIRRWQDLTGRQAIHSASNEPFSAREAKARDAQQPGGALNDA